MVSTVKYLLISCVRHYDIIELGHWKPKCQVQFLLAAFDAVHPNRMSSLTEVYPNCMPG